MVKVVSSAGELTNTVADIIQLAQKFPNTDWTDASTVIQLGSQAANIFYPGHPLLELSSAMASVAPITNGVMSISQGLQTNDARKVSDGLLDLISGVGGLLSSGLVPHPGAKAAGLAISIMANAAKMNRDRISDFLDPDNLSDLLEDVRRMLFPDYDLQRDLADAVSGRYRDAKNPPRRDPLAIDLDRDGIETVGVGSAGPILFDHDADGIRTGTGWLKGDDAWLVMDRNGNGAIDSGQELFGVDTQITDGAGVQRSAFSGFEALASFDGNKDKVFDAQDAAFSQVRLWQDFNQDGISQANELGTLAQKGIVSISLVSTAANTNLGNGNAITGTATVTFGNQTTTDVDSVSVTGSSAGNLDLADNPFYREFPSIPVTEAARALPEMGGSGWARDLREAMSQDTAAAQVLFNTVSTFAQASTRQAQLNLVDTLLSDWASSTGKYDITPSLIEGVRATLINESGNTRTYRITAIDPGQLQALLNSSPSAAYDAAQFVFNDEKYAKKPGIYQHEALQLTEAGIDVMQRLAVLEVFNGQRFIDFTTIRTTSSGGGNGSAGSGSGGGGVYVPPTGPQVRYEIQITANQIESLNQAYDALRESVYASLVTQTRLRSYLDAITFTIEDGEIEIDTTPFVTLLSSNKASNAARALIDLIELNRYAHETLSAVGFDGIALLRTWISEFSAQPWLASTLADLRVNLGTLPTLSASADLYLGLDGRDTVNSGDGNDLIDAGASADYVNAGAGLDTLLGGAGNDTLYGGNDADLLKGGADNDTLYGEAGADILDGGSGNDYLSGGDGKDTYRFGRGSGQDTIYNHDSDALGTNADAIQLGDGITASDIELSRSGDTLIISIIGTNDQLQIQNYFYQDGQSVYAVEKIRFGDGTQLSIDQVKSLILAPNQQASQNQTGYGTADLLQGANGRDTLDGRGGNDTIYGAAGSDYLSGGDGNDKVQGGSGNDSLSGGNGNDLLQGDSRPEKVVISAKASLAGGVGAELQLWINGQKVGSTEVRSTSGWADYTFDIDLPQGRDVSLDVVFANDATVNGEDRNLWINTVRVGSHVMNPTDPGVKVDRGNGAGAFDGLDVIAGSGGLFWNAALRFTVPLSVVGSGGNDNLNGDAGNDTLDGGAGNDWLSGGDGADVYLFGRGDGQDSISNYDSDASGVNADSIQLGAGIAVSDVVLTRSGTDLIISIKGTDDQLRVSSYFYQDAASSYAVETIKFADGTIWDLATVKSKVLLSTDGNDSLTGYATVDNLSGGDGHDALNGEGGNDTLDGGAGQDNLNGGAGSDVLKGGLGRDTLYGGNDADSLQGNEHDDNLYGEAGNDTLDGGSGNDNLQGGAGADVYRFGRGSGQDTIYNHDSDTLGTNADAIELGANVLTTDVVLTRSSDDLIIRIHGTTDQVVVQSYFNQDATAAYALESIKFADGTIWDIAAVKTKVLVSTTGNDSLIGYATADSLSGGDGSDYVGGLAGNDTLDGGAGQDYMSGGDGDDVLKGGLGNDVLYGGNDADSLQGNEHNDYLYGDAGNDTLDGGTGSDNLQGGNGADVYRFGRGSGQDTIYNHDSDTLGTNADVIELGAGVLTTDVVLTRSSDDLIIRIHGTTDQVVVQSYFNQDATAAYALESIKFADGTIWDIAAVKTKVLVSTTGNDSLIGYATADSLSGGDGSDYVGGLAGSDTLDGGAGQDYMSGGDGDDVLKGGLGNDVLYGGNDADSLQGNEHNDYLYGDAGNDTLDGGSGNDSLQGGNGADVYRFGRGSGQDSIYNHDSDALGTNADAVELGAGVLTTDVVLTRSSDDLLISIAGTDDVLRVQSYFYLDGTAAYTVENLKFADGTTWNYAAVKSRLSTATTPVGVTQSGTSAAESLTGGAGHDNLSGGAGNDTLSGGAGNDYLQGDAGNDTYIFGKGSGKDTIYSYDSTAGKQDVVQLGAGIAVADVVLTRSSDDLLLTIKGSSDSLRINSYFYGDATSGYQVEQIKFADGTIWDVASVKARLIIATADHDVLTGYATADSLTGLAGDDSLYGRAGNDTLDGGAGEDRLSGEDGDDVLRGGTQNDTLYGDAGNDSLLGQESDDALYGGAGNDTLDGGIGNDYLSGDAGNDIFVFGKGYGRDTISSYDGTVGKSDVVQLGAGITTADVVLTRSGDTLVLSLKGSADSLRIESYFYSDATYGYQVEQIKFADGTIWDVATVKSKAITATTDHDVLTGYATADSLTGLAGDDTLYGRAGNDTLDGGAGEDRLSGEDGDDVLRGATQNDTLYGDAGNDSLLGQEGDDNLSGGSGNDTLDGGVGNDYLSGDAGNDVFIFGKGYGRDTVSSYDSTSGKTDVVQLGTGITTADVVLTRSSDDLLLTIKGTSDSLRISSYFYSDATYGYQVEQIKFADGTIWDVATVKSRVIITTADNDALIGYAAADSLSGLAGDDTVYGRAGNDTLDGGAGEDRLYGEDGDDLIRGGTQNDTLSGDAGSDNLLGQDGDDTLYGGAGNDTLDGGAGSDYLMGDAGNDTYLFGKGSGKDTIYNYDSTAGKQDVVQLGAGIATADVVLTRSSDDLVLRIKGTPDSLRISSYFYNDATYGYQVEQIKFADGTIWDVAAVKNKVTLNTVGNDGLTGYLTADVLNGADGDDAVYGRAGNDTLDGGSGEDRLYGEEGDDVLRGGTQNDTLYGDAGSDSLLGQDGDDSLVGGSGNDTLDGGAGNDTLQADVGNDTYLFGKGSGKDTIYNYDSTSGKQDVVQLGAGITAADVVLTRVGDDLLLTIKGTSDILRISSYFYNDGTYGYQIEQIKFADGTGWDVAAVKSRVTAGTTANDVLTGYAIADSLSGLAGDDELYGRAGNDTLDGGAGEDRISGEEGDDLLLGGSQNDTMYGDGGNDSLLGQDGDDHLSGGSGNDTLDGGAGNDSLLGGSGNDTYLFGKGHGRDTISGYDGTAGKLDVIRLDSSVAPADVVLNRVGDNLLIGFTDTTDVLVVDSFFYLNAAGGYQVEQIIFSNGTVWDVAAIKARVSGATAGDDTIVLPAGHDAINGLAGHDSISGGAGNDTLNGGDGIDTLTGGLGNDSLTGGTGNDTFVFAKGAGVDRVSDSDSTAGNIDTISFTDVKSTEVTSIERLGDNLVIKYGTGDQVTVENQFTSDTYEIEQIKFSDGVTWNEAAMKSRVVTNGDAANNSISGYGDGSNRINGLDGHDTLYGASLSDTLDGGAGNDWLSGGGGLDYLRGGDGSDTLSGGDGADFLYGLNHDDSIIGGAGNDAIWSGRGNDTLEGGLDGDVYFFNPGDGSDLIRDYDTVAGNSDAIVFSGAVLADQLWFRKTGTSLADLEISVIGTSDKVVVKDWFSGAAYQVEEMQAGGDGKILSNANVLNLVNAMAQFTPPAAGQTTLPANYQASLTPVIAANWVAT
jgi:Ca2+-binding RTX toxin-like protein